MASHHEHRTLVITIKAPRGLTQTEADQLAERVRQVVGGDRYQTCTHHVLGSQRIKVGPYGKKGDVLDSIANLPPEMTADEIAQRLGLSQRQVYRYRALLKRLATD